MNFTPVDLKTWNRKEYFEHYLHDVPCTYSMTVKLDITAVRKSGKKLYPVMLYCLASAVNTYPEFRTALDASGSPGIFGEMHPSYTIFHPETQTFSNPWTKYDPDFDAFCAAYEKDLAVYGKAEGFSPKPGMPKNTFCVSMIPWISFEGFQLNLQKGYDSLLPIFTMGRFYTEGEKTILPLAMQVHHAVCDGFHACRFLKTLQELVNRQ